MSSSDLSSTTASSSLIAGSLTTSLFSSMSTNASAIMGGPVTPAEDVLASFEPATTALSPLATNWTGNVSNVTLSHSDCQLILQEFLRNNTMEFDNVRMFRVLLSWTFFLISAVGNSFVLTSVTIRRRRRAISHSQLMMMHLTIANLLFTVFIIPLDAIWQTTIQWYGGEVLCRLTNVLKQFAMYSSSAMVVVMGVDRAANLMCPMSIPGQRRRIRTMLIIAWIFCAVNAIPAGFIFSIIEIDTCPHYSEYTVVQCVDLQVRGIAKLGVYYVYTMLVSFFGPLVCILVCYLLIALAISRMARLSKEAQKRCLKQRPQSSGKSVTRRGLDRARMVSLIVTGLITAIFIICWGPYYVTGLIEWFVDKPVIPRTVRDILLMFFYLNPMLHPLIAALLMKEIRENILTQCRSSGRGSSSRKTLNRNNQPMIVNMENNGLLEQKNGNGTGNTKREWL